MSGRIRSSRPVGGQHSTLIGSSVFLRLSTVASGLPSHEEQVLLSSMDWEPTGTGGLLAGAYDPGVPRPEGRPDGRTRGKTVYDLPTPAQL